MLHARKGAGRGPWGLGFAGAVLGEHGMGTMTPHQGLVVGALWCAGAVYDRL